MLHFVVPSSGRLAQLGERRVRNAEVGSSSLLPSTTFLNNSAISAAVAVQDRPPRSSCARCVLNAGKSSVLSFPAATMWLKAVCHKV